MDNHNDETFGDARQYTETDSIHDYSYSDLKSLLTHEDVSGLIGPHDVLDVLYAEGNSTEEGYAAWSGAFILKLKDGRLAIIYGGCDTTGWGCQDSSSVVFCQEHELEQTLSRNNFSDLHTWDRREDTPILADFTSYLAEGKESWDI